ncbi:hypothetical protein HK100_002503, partial [Physocladia obscura]
MEMTSSSEPTNSTEQQPLSESSTETAPELMVVPSTSSVLAATQQPPYEPAVEQKRQWAWKSTVLEFI